MIKLLPALSLACLFLVGCGNTSSQSQEGSSPSGTDAATTGTGDASTTAPTGDAGQATTTNGDGAPTSEADAAPSTGARACPPRDQWPEGMACVQGGTFTLGSDQGEPDEQQPGEVFVASFYMDLHEATNERFERCITANRCKRPMRYVGFMEPNQPRVAVSWQDAATTCEMEGKRLPTEAEWERAAAGPEHTQYPWGNEPGGCDAAHVKTKAGAGCGQEITLPVGSKAAGHFGLFDMAGNVHEWVADWYSPCLRGCEGECGDDCFGRNPRGPCGGADTCTSRTKRSIRGGSWYWPEERARTTARRGADPENSHNHRFGFRCARDLAGSGGPTASTTEQPSEPTTPTETDQTPPAKAVLAAGPLSAEIRQALAALPGEKLSMPDEHYFHTNEWRHDVLEPQLRGLGGAFIGVGADQNYTMAALADSELLLCVDFDPRIPRLHKIYEVFVIDSPTPEALVEKFAESATSRSAKLLRANLGDEPDADAIVSQFRRFRSPWHTYLSRQRRLERDGRPFGWLSDTAQYEYVRRMFQEGRVVARPGDVTGETTLRGMGRALTELGVPAQVVYFSNAEQFFRYTPGFIENIQALPTTPRSLVVRTIRHRRLANAEGDSWHYVAHNANDFRERLETGAYPRATAVLSDLLSAGRDHQGRNGLSIITDAVPRREAERAAQ